MMTPILTCQSFVRKVIVSRQSVIFGQLAAAMVIRRYSSPPVIAGHYLAELCRALSIDADRLDSLLQRYRLSLTLLDQPGYLLPAEHGLPLLHNLLTLAPDPGLGLRLGRRLHLRTHGFLGYAILSSATLGEAIDLMIRYLRTRTTLFELRLFREHEHAVIQIDENLGLGPMQPLLIDTLITLMLVCGEQVTGLPFQGEVRLAYSRQPHHAHWPELRHTRVVFDAAFNQVRFSRQALKLSIRHADPRLRDMARQQCEHEMARLQDHGGLIAGVREQLRQRLATGVTATSVAQTLGMSERTLRRRLTELGTSYQLLVEQLRRGRAVELLRRGDLSVDAIAAELGYDDPSNFSRAFKRWTGLSPRSYRQQPPT